MLKHPDKLESMDNGKNIDIWKNLKGGGLGESFYVKFNYFLFFNHTN